jgi:hypothetical protein
MEIKTVLSIKQRLAKYSTLNDATGCIEWHGYKDKDNYGVLLVCENGIKKNTKAHRLAYQLFVEPIPDGMFVCHKCDNPSCIATEHLFLGTPADNVADMMRKGRYKQGGKPHPGEKNGMAKLCQHQVDGVRRLVKFGITQRSIARSLSMHRSSILKIVHVKSWANR